VQAVPASFSAFQAGATENPFAAQAGNPFAAVGATGEALDSANPYAAPVGYQRDPQFGAVAGQIVPTHFDIFDVFSRAWKVFQPNMLNIIGACLVIFMAYMAASMVLGGVAFAIIVATANQSRVMPLVAQFTQQILLVVISSWLFAGLLSYLLALGRGRPANFTDIFSGGRYVWRVLLSLLLIYAAEIALFAATLGPGFSALFALGESHPATIGLFVGGGLVLLVFLLYVGLGISQYMFALIDQDCGVLQSFRISWHIMRGNRLSFFALALLSGLLAVSGFLACGIGALFTGPLTYFVITFAYLVMAGQPTAEPMYRSST
jgi:hypothetical protein